MNYYHSKMPSQMCVLSLASLHIMNLFSERKRMRESTTLKSLEVKKRTMQSMKNQDLNKRTPSKHHVLTQEQLLEEAKITEVKNLKSLGMLHSHINS